MAATGTPTPNIGLRRPQGTDPASVDDINYNSNLIDTKLGAVGNTSVQEQINSLNSKIEKHDNTSSISAGASCDELGANTSAETIGNIIVLNVNIKVKASASSGTYLLTGIPNGSKRGFASTVTHSGSDIRMYTSGTNLYLDSESGSGGWINAVLVYPSA